ncbi:MAG: phosphoribosyl-ATP diphosphatase [Hyphomicrobiales bacterium]|nr:phosphoribosyl-ATP diphosphatase [Hyphomicrobiales bacterium]
MDDSLDRLYASILAARDLDPACSRTSRLFRGGVEKMARKVAEEAIEVGFDAVKRRRECVVLESADLLYNLSVLWAQCGITPSEVTAELERREALYGIAEKLRKGAGHAPRKPA